jgi:hypothetical protein
MPDLSTILTWIVIPVALDESGLPTVAVRLSPQLGAPPTGTDSVLASYPDFVDWPDTVLEKKLSFRLSFYPLNSDQPIGPPMETALLSAPTSGIWRHLFPSDTPVTTRGIVAAGAVADARTPSRRYESYSVRKFAHHMQGSYLDLAAKSLSGMRREGAAKGVGADRARVASLEGVPVPRPTVREIRDQFRSSNLFLPQTPREALRLELQQALAAFDEWVERGVTGRPEPAVRDQAKGRVNFFLGRLRPLPSPAPPNVEIRRLFKPGPFKAIVERVLEELGIAPQYWPWNPTTTDVGAADDSAMTMRDHLDHALFHRPLPEVPLQAPETARFDFHALVSMLSSHPVLYPYAGLVFDLRGKTPIPNQQSFPKARIAVEPSWGEELVQKPTVRCPRTAYQVFPKHPGQKQRFLPCSRSEATRGRNAREEDRVHEGVLDVTDAQYFHLEIMDTHGDHFKTRNLESNETPGSPDALTIDAREGATPKLRSCGIALVRTHRKDKLAKVAVINSALQADLDQDKLVTFYAEDLTVGYRVDVCVIEEGSPQGATGKWRSLCQRASTLKFLPPGPMPPDDWKPGTADELDARRVEGVVGSGAAQAVDADQDEFQLLETLFRWENWSLAAPLPIKALPDQEYDDQRQPLRLRATHRAKALPALRYRYGYFVRCRAAFLDGSGLELADCDESLPKLGDGHGAPFTFQRLESVDTPVVLLDGPLDPKQRPGEHLAHMVIRKPGASSRRHVVPPRVSPHFAFLHGKLDPTGHGAFRSYMWDDLGRFATVAEFLDKPHPAPDKDPAEGNAIFALYRGRPFHLKHPYLPDPAARGAQFTLLDRRRTNKADIELPSFYNDHPHDSWPAARSFAIHLEGADDAQTNDAAMKWHEDGHVAIVKLKKGRTATLLVSPGLNGANESLAGSSAPLFKFAALLSERFESAAPSPELHWLLIAKTELDLVHAVEKPLMAPRFESLTATAKLGANSVSLRGSVSLDADSTGEIEISASWTDQLDPCHCNDPAPVALTRGPIHPQRIDLSAFEQPGEGSQPLDFDHLINDTKYHEITYAVSGKSRFAPYYDDPATTAGRPDHSGRFTIADQRNDRIIDVCNRAAPDLPEVLYLLPIFRWEDQKLRHRCIRRRHGGGVRVYMNCRWYSAGNGELLAALLPEASGAMSDSTSRLVTQWGIDPLLDGSPLPLSPAVSDFQGVQSFVRRCDGSATPETSLAHLPLVENSDVLVTAVGFAPQFDCERKLAYCDIILSPQAAYYPFVRFALARFQPNSVRGAHLSKVVTADFVQLAPDRWVMIQRTQHKLTVSIYGFTYRSSYAEAHGSEMLVRLEQRVSGASDALCWIPIVDDDGREIMSQIQPEPLSTLERLNLLREKPEGLEAGMSVWRVVFDLPKCAFAIRRRIQVEEIETFLADDRSPGKTIADTNSCRRTVFAATVALM